MSVIQIVKQEQLVTQDCYSRKGGGVRGCGVVLLNHTIKWKKSIYKEV